ncbi:TIGR02391 family protein [uncultured Microbacterium sp.]|uniref:TIGR02391 family protein n=1 Tax=uncultured Microbacterium sp. TaxID=191216 RepID=UPI0025E8C283|nr:TIGR02391 family protein [uncultured Microbacterium sp.]
MINESVRSLSNDEIAQLPVDRLALMVLADAIRVDTWNWRNWALGFAQDRDRAGLPHAQDAIAEAWGWLSAKTLISTKGAGNSFDFHDFHVTRAGHDALSRGLGYIQASIRLDVELVEQLEQKVRPQFLLGDYELAAFAAMREVEIAVRERSGLGADLIGTALMQSAFKEGGPLHDPAIHAGESVAQMNLFAGAMGLFKNPASHRRVDYDDPTQASEVILLADLLLRILGR